MGNNNTDQNVVHGFKVFDKSECGQLWWSRLSDMEKKIIKAIPNFDAEIFFHCTGIRVDE